jgi:hypothetical protein
LPFYINEYAGNAENARKIRVSAILYAELCSQFNPFLILSRKKSIDFLKNWGYGEGLSIQISMKTLILDTNCYIESEIT